MQHYESEAELHIQDPTTSPKCQSSSAAMSQKDRTAFLCTSRSLWSTPPASCELTSWWRYEHASLPVQLAPAGSLHIASVLCHTLVESQIMMRLQIWHANATGYYSGVVGRPPCAISATPYAGACQAACQHICTPVTAACTPGLATLCRLSSCCKLGHGPGSPAPQHILVSQQLI